MNNTEQLSLPEYFKEQLAHILPTQEIKLSKTFREDSNSRITSTNPDLLTFQYYPNDFTFINYGKFILKITDTELARFSLYQMPHCCGIMMLSKLEVNINYRRKGVGSILLKLVEYIAFKGKYTKVICTNVTPEFNALLNKHQWNLLDTFTNRNTDNTVKMWVKEV